MTSFAPSAGNVKKYLFGVFLLLGSLSVQAQEPPGLEQPPPSYVYRRDELPFTTKQLVTFGLSTTAVYYLISQTKNGPLIFGGLYAMGTLVLMRETYYKNETEAADLVVPFTLLAFSVLNISLLNNNDHYTYDQVFAYNMIGTGIVAAYALWEISQHDSHGRRRHYGDIVPFIQDNHSGLAWTLGY